MRRHGVSILTAEDVTQWDMNVELPYGYNKKWTPARPYGLGGFFHRVKCAWMVFTGKADVLKWRDQ